MNGRQSAKVPTRHSVIDGATKYSSDLTLLSLATLDSLKPGVSLGLLGTPRVGTYRVRVAGSPVGVVPEFYASYMGRNADGTRSLFFANTGSVTISSISGNTIHGTFSFHSSQVTNWPAVITAGTTATPGARRRYDFCCRRATRSTMSRETSV